MRFMFTAPCHCNEVSFKNDYYSPTTIESITESHSQGSYLDDRPGLAAWKLFLFLSSLEDTLSSSYVNIYSPNHQIWAQTFSTLEYPKIRMLRVWLDIEQVKGTLRRPRTCEFPDGCWLQSCIVRGTIWVRLPLYIMLPLAGWSSYLQVWTSVMLSHLLQRT